MRFFSSRNRENFWISAPTLYWYLLERRKSLPWQCQSVSFAMSSHHLERRYHSTVSLDTSKCMFHEKTLSKVCGKIRLLQSEEVVTRPYEIWYQWRSLHSGILPVAYLEVPLSLLSIWHFGLSAVGMEETQEFPLLQAELDCVMH